MHKTLESHAWFQSPALSRSWDALVAVCASLAALAIPLRLVLHLGDRAGMIFLEQIVTAIFSLDILAHLLRARWPQGDFPLHASRPRVRSYLMSWFIIDLLAALPLSFMLGSAWLQFLRLLKLARVAQFTRQWRQRAVKSSNFLRLAFFGYWIMLSAHWIACGWLALRGFHAEDGRWSDYITALYWTVQTLATVGYGDMPAANDAQRLYAIAVMIFGAGVYGYIIGNVATILANIDPARVQHLQNLDRLTAFMNYRNIPPALQERIRAYYSYLWEKRLSYDESTVISALPPSLKTEVSLFLKRDIIEKVPLFQGASDEFIKEIALQMTPLVFLPGDHVYRAGEPARDMYFISRGRLEVVSKDGGQIYNTLTDGDFFGEIALIKNQRRSASVRAISYCDLYRLDKEMFDRVLAQYPEIAAHIKSKAKERQER